MLESRDMKIDKQILTGDSELQSVTVEMKENQEDIFETTHLTFFGTVCKEGSGKGVVIRTGKNTALGGVRPYEKKKTVRSRR